MPDRATVIMFLCFSIIVAYLNVLVGNYQYVAFTIPFIFAAVTKGRLSKIAEIIGLYFIAIYIMAFETTDMGIMMFVVTAVFFFVSTEKLLASRIYMYITAALVATISYIRFDTGADRVVHAALDSGLFAVGSGALYCVIYRAIDQAKENVKPLDQKYIDKLDEFRKIAVEIIDEIKNLQGGSK